MGTGRRNGSHISGLLLISLSVYGCSGGGGGGGGMTPPNQQAPNGDTLAVTSANRFFAFNRASPSAANAMAITGLQSGENVVGIDVRPSDNNLYALTNQNRLYIINTSTGAATLKTPLTAAPNDPFTGLTGQNFGVDVNPAVDVLRVVGDDGQNLRVNMDTGVTITDGTLTVNGQTRTGITAVTYTNNFASSCQTVVSFIDSTNGIVLTSANTSSGVLTPVGNLGLGSSPGAVSAYEIVTSGTTTAVDTAIAALTVGGTTTLYTINLSAGTATSNGAFTGLNSGETVIGLGILPPTTPPQQSLGALLGITDSNNLISFNQANPNRLCTQQAVTGLQAGDKLVAIDSRPANNMLYALAASTPGSATSLYTINPTTAAVTNRVSLAQPLLGTAEFGMEFNPIANAIRVISDTGNNYVVNADTGAVTTAGQNPMTPPPGSPAVSIVGLSYSNGFSGTATIAAYVLDSNNDQLMTLGLGTGNAAGGDLLPIAQLTNAQGQRLDFGPASSLEVNAVNNMGVAVLNPAGTAGSELHTINLVTGVNTRINSIGPSGGNVGLVRDITFTRNPAATAVGVTADNRVVTFSPTAPGAFISGPMPITGLQGGESIVGIDMRPANGTVVALTSQGRYFTINPATGAATLLSSIQGSTLMGANFGPDFNPLVNLIRVFSDAEQNVVHNVDTGATAATNGTLNRAPFAVTAVGYNNNFTGGPATQLYALDTDNDLLLTIPAGQTGGGVLTAVGPLGVNFDSFANFDIVGASTAFAVGNANGSTLPALYSIDLTTGAATLVGSVTVPGNALDGPARFTGLGTPTTQTPPATLPIFGIVNGVALVSFNANLSTPGNITTSPRMPITGLQRGERIVGADFRPANNQFYAVAVANAPTTVNGQSVLRGNLYTINTTTGAATLIAQLTTNGAPFGFPVSANAPIGSYGVDFNPQADALRVQNDQFVLAQAGQTQTFGQNLAVLVDGSATPGAVTAQTGLTFPLSPATLPVPVDIVGTAYTANYVMGPPTRAMTLDAVTSSLFRTDTASGRLSMIGRVLPPSSSFSSIVGFDIVGGEDGLSVAALQLSGQSQSTLYRIDPRTGGSVNLGPIGPNGASAITGLALLLQ